MRKKDHHPIYHLGKMYDAMMVFKPASSKWFKDSHQISCKIQVRRFALLSLIIMLLVSGCAWFRSEEERTAQELASDGMEQ